MAPLKKSTVQRKAAAAISAERRRQYKLNPPKNIKLFDGASAGKTFILLRKEFEPTDEDSKLNLKVIKKLETEAILNKKIINVTTGDDEILIDGRKLFYLDLKSSVITDLGLCNIFNRLKKMMHKEQKIGAVSIMSWGGTGNKSEKEPTQAYHMDYEFNGTPLARNQTSPTAMPYTVHIPLTKDGSYLNILNEPKISLEFGDILLVRGDLRHAGGEYTTASYRMHIYIDTDLYVEDGSEIHI